MKRFLQCLLLLGVVTSAPVIAQETSMCKSLCNAEKRECAAMARRLSSEEVRPFAEMKRGRDAETLGKLQSTPLEARRDEQSDLLKRTRERDSACENRARTCSRACSTPPPETESSVLLKPKTQP